MTAKEEKELEELRHKNVIEEIEAEKKAKIEVEKLKFDLDLQRQRIRNADIKRNMHEKFHFQNN